MKKVIIYMLLPIFMLNSSLGELFQLPVLLSHFTEHQAQNKHLGIGDFISMHYLGGDDQDDTDQDKDMKLPFKKIDSHFSFQIATIPNFTLLPKNQSEVIDSYLQIAFKNNRPKNPTLAVLHRPPCMS